MTTLIFVRHGQSLANFSGIFAGHSDFDLSELGHKQAEASAEYICKNYKIDKIYSSDLLRAYNTALPVSKRLGIPVIAATDFREINGGLWEGLTFDEIAQRYPKEYKVWSTDFSNAQCPEGESARDIYLRIKKATLDLAKTNPDATLLIGAHATVIRAVECFAKGFSEYEMGKVRFTHNASINVFSYENGVLKPEKINIIEHLGDLATAVPDKINA